MVICPPSHCPPGRQINVIAKRDHRGVSASSSPVPMRSPKLDTGLQQPSSSQPMDQPRRIRNHRPNAVQDLDAFPGARVKHAVSPRPDKGTPVLKDAVLTLRRQALTHTAPRSCGASRL